MNSARFRFDGLAQLITGLRQLPAELTGTAGRIVSEAADSAASEIADAYPVGPGSADGSYAGGNLKAHVTVATKNAGQFGVVRQVRSTAKHAHLFEFGTQARQTSLGYNRGPMPGANIFIPTVMRHRRRMYEELKDLLREAGFNVRS